MRTGSGPQALQRTDDPEEGELANLLPIDEAAGSSWWHKPSHGGRPSRVQPTEVALHRRDNDSLDITVLQEDMVEPERACPRPHSQRLIGSLERRPAPSLLSPAHTDASRAWFTPASLPGLPACQPLVPMLNQDLGDAHPQFYSEPPCAPTPGAPGQVDAAWCFPPAPHRRRLHTIPDSVQHVADCVGTPASMHHSQASSQHISHPEVEPTSPPAYPPCISIQLNSENGGEDAAGGAGAANDNASVGTACTDMLAPFRSCPQILFQGETQPWRHTPQAISRSRSVEPAQAEDRSLPLRHLPSGLHSRRPRYQQHPEVIQGLQPELQFSHHVQQGVEPQRHLPPARQQAVQTSPAAQLATPVQQQHALTQHLYALAMRIGVVQLMWEVVQAAHGDQLPAWLTAPRLHHILDSIIMLRSELVLLGLIAVGIIIMMSSFQLTWGLWLGITLEGLGCAGLIFKAARLLFWLYRERRRAHRH